jgi:hypothetical protein
LLHMLPKSSLVLLAVIVYILQVDYSCALTIAEGYAATQASVFVSGPDTPRLALTTHTAVVGGESYTTLIVNASFNLEEAAQGIYAAIPAYPPASITFAYPYCASRVEIVSEFPAHCVGGKLVYGYIEIPEVFSPPHPDANNASVLNGVDASNQISGVSIRRLDQGGSSPSTGTLTYIPPESCADVIGMLVPDFQVNIRFTGSGMYDVADATPMEFLDAFSGYSQLATVYGLGCTRVPRSNTAPSINFRPVAVPVCKAGVPGNTPHTAEYEEIYGSGFYGPDNLPVDTIPYQIRLDGFIPNIYMAYSVISRNISYEVIPFPPSVPGFDIQYGQVSRDVIAQFLPIPTFQPPLVVTVCMSERKFSSPPYLQEPPCRDGLFTFREPELGYLQICSCGSTPNIWCAGNTTAVVNTLFNRTSIPYFDGSQSYAPHPICGIVINTNTNSTEPVPNQVFSLISASFGGVGALYYNWRFIGAPPSTAEIGPPSDTGSVNAIVYYPGTYTVQLVVYANNGLSSSCTRTFQSIDGIPQLCITPSTMIVTIAAGETYPLDASCSHNPLPSALIFTWSVFSYYNPPVFPFILSSPLGATTSVKGEVPGSGIVFLNVTNEATTVGTAIYIYVTAVPPPPGTPIPPYTIPFTPGTNCFVPTPPVYVPFVPPNQMPPLGNLPIGPASPMTLNPSGSSPDSGVIGPLALEESTIVTLAVITVMAFFVCIVLIPVAECARRRRRDDVIKRGKSF